MEKNISPKSMDCNTELEASRRFMLPMGNFGMRSQRLSSVLVEKNVPHSPLDPIAHAPQMCLGMLDVNGSFQRFADSFTSSFSKPDIRKREKKRLKELVRPGRVIQVCGAPLVGKSTFVNEALDDLCSHSDGRQRIIQHHVNCKGLSSYSSILSTLFNELQIKEPPNTIAPVHQIHAGLREWLDLYHHIFIFHKCEAVKTSQEHFRFSDFLALLSQMLNTTVIFTTYKLLPQQSNIQTLKLEMLSDASDIQALLKFYSFGNPNAHGPGYVSLILRTNLCFPLAIRYFAQTYLQGHISPQPEEIEESIQRNSLSFLDECLGHRLSEIDSWLQVEKLKWIVHFCHTMDASFSEELLLEMTEENRSRAGWNATKAHLQENFALCHEPGLGRLRFHPLVILYFMKALESQRLVLRGDWFDQSCNKVVKFLCNILNKTETVSRYHGNKFALFKCLLPEWCNMKNAIQMAIYRKDYKVYWKVATMGASLLIKWSPDEAIEFYKAMFESSRQNGFRSRKETAVLEGCLAYAFAQGRACCWKIASQHFHSALDVLRREDCSFHTSQTLCNFARMLARQGKYHKSLRTFRESQIMLMKSVDEGDEDQFYVSDWQREELDTTINILRTIPRIFCGDNVEALKSLHLIMQGMEDKNLYHFEYSTVLNLMGLAVQRGNGDLDRAIFYYRQSLEERMHLINVCPQDLVVPYNNLSMLQARRGQIDKALQNLFNALSIRQRTGWKDYYTALTLIHIADIFLKQDKLVSALDYYSQADDILVETSKNHDLRLRLNLNLAHTSLALAQKYDESQRTNSGPCSCEVGQQQRSSFIGGTKAQSASSNSTTSFSHMNAMASRACLCNCKISLDVAFPHRKSAKDYFRKVYSLARQSKGTLSDHGHGQLLSSLEHLTLLEWGNLSQMRKYRDRMEEIMTTYSWVIEELKKPVKECNRFITCHYQVFKYLSSVDPNDLDLKYVVETARASCEFCQARENYFSVSAWENYILDSLRSREKSVALSNQCGSKLDSMDSSNSSSLGDSDCHLSDRPGEEKSLDLYMNLACSFSSTNGCEESNSDLCSKDIHKTDKKYYETKSFVSSELSLAAKPVEKQKEQYDFESCVSNEDNLQCDPGCIQICHRSIEETSWNSNFGSLSVGSHRQKNTAVPETAAPLNIPNFSRIDSFPSGNEFTSLQFQTQAQSSLNNSDCNRNVSDERVFRNLIETFTPVSNANPNCSSLHDNVAGAYICEKRCTSTETSSTSLHHQDGAHCWEYFHCADGKKPPVESGYVSSDSSPVGGYGGRPSKHTYHRIFSPPTEYGHGLNESNNVRSFYHQEDDMRSTLHTSDSPSPHFKVNDSFTRPSVGSCYVGSGFHGFLYQSNGNTEAAVFVDNNQNLNGGIGDLVTKSLDLTLEDKQIQPCHGSFPPDPKFKRGEETVQHKKIPSEQDERDVK